MAGVYKLVSCDDLKDVAQELRSAIHHAYKADRDHLQCMIFFSLISPTDLLH